MAFLSCTERTWLRINAGGKHNTCRSNGEKSESERLWTEVSEHPLEGRMEGDGSHCKRDAEKPRLSQYRFVNPTIFSTSFYAFRGRFFDMVGYGNHIPAFRKSKTDEFLKRLHSVAYRVTKAEALDLPDITEETRYVELETKAMKLYRELAKESYAEMERGEITASNVLTKILRLSQMTGGFVGDDDKSMHAVSTAKMEALEDILDWSASGRSQDRRLLRWTVALFTWTGFLRRLRRDDDPPDGQVFQSAGQQGDPQGLDLQGASQGTEGERLPDAQHPGGGASGRHLFSDGASERRKLSGWPLPQGDRKGRGHGQRRLGSPQADGENSIRTRMPGRVCQQRTGASCRAFFA